MSKASRKALDELTAARKRLAKVQSNPNPTKWVAGKEYLDANDAVNDAESKVTLGRARGWKW